MELDRLVRRQHGYVTWRQLLDAGLSHRQIDYRIGDGRLVRRYPGVYGHVPPSPLSAAAAALLACGPRAALGHASGLALWGVWRWRAPFEVVAPTDRRHEGITTHRSRTLARCDVTTQSGLRVTSPARTLHDMAPRLSDLRLARVYNELRRANYLRPAALQELLARLPSRRLARLLELRGGPTRSELEDAFLAFCAAHGLPTPHTGVIVAGHEVDAYFPEQRVIVELDSVEFHLDPVAFEADRDRDADTLAAGQRTVRVTHERMTGAAPREAERLARILNP
jgi:hypothetical protein